MEKRYSFSNTVFHVHYLEAYDVYTKRPDAPESLTGVLLKL